MRRKSSVMCSSSRCRNLQIVVSSGTGSAPKSMPANWRNTTESYSPSSTAGSDKLNTAAENKSAASVPAFSAVARCLASDSAAQSARTTSPTAPPAPSLPERSPAASSSYIVRIPSSSPMSSAPCESSCWSDSIQAHCGNGGLNQSLLRQVNCTPRRAGALAYPGAPERRSRIGKRSVEITSWRLGRGGR